MAALLAACGSDDDTDADRIISSPDATATVPDVVTASPARRPRRAVAGGRPTAGAAATQAPGRARRDTPAPTSAPEPRRGEGEAHEGRGHRRPRRDGDCARATPRSTSRSATPGRSVRSATARSAARSSTSAPRSRPATSRDCSAWRSRPTARSCTCTSRASAGRARPGTTSCANTRSSNGRATSPRDLLRVADPEGNHNGGNILFGPDGYLYVALGDGGGARRPPRDDRQRPEPQRRCSARSCASTRSRPDRARTRSRSDNPFVGRDGRDEIWAYGLRNPWRFSFDRSTGDLWIGDVGQNAWEEVDFDRDGSDGGDNYGWRRMEGTHSYNGGTRAVRTTTDRSTSTRTTRAARSPAGYVYRGSKIHDLDGAYVFADFCEGLLRAFVQRRGPGDRTPLPRPEARAAVVVRTEQERRAVRDVARRRSVPARSGLDRTTCRRAGVLHGRCAGSSRRSCCARSRCSRCRGSSSKRGPDRGRASSRPRRARPLELLELKLTLAARVPRPTAMAYATGDDAIYIASKKGWVWRLIRRRSDEGARHRRTRSRSGSSRACSASRSRRTAGCSSSTSRTRTTRPSRGCTPSAPRGPWSRPARI